MILCSKSVENVLLRLFFTGFERTGQGGKQYFDAIESFSKLPHSVFYITFRIFLIDSLIIFRN